MPDDLFDRLATIDGTTPKLFEESSEEESAGSDGDGDDDGPPPLISGSDDEIPPLEEYDSDYDRGPEISGDNSSDDEEPEPSRPQARPPRKVPSRKHVARPVQPGPSSGLAPSRRAGVDITNSQDWDEEEEEDEPKRREKIKTRKVPVEKDGNASDATMRGASGSEWETTDSESEREGLPADFKFKVSKRVYGTFELVLGGDNVVRHVAIISSSNLPFSADVVLLFTTRTRTEVAWIDFMYAMQSIGFQSLKGAGSTWKFRPPSRFRHLGTM